MSPELSSNWRKLQATIRSEATQPHGQKRTAGGAAADQERELPASKKPKGTAPGAGAASKGPKPEAHAPAPSPPGRGALMGATQSRPGVLPPALERLADDPNLSAGALREAFRLRFKDDSPQDDPAVPPNHGFTMGVKVGQYIAIDCEMVNVGIGRRKDALARVSIVNFHGQQIYDSYVRPKEEVTDWRTSISGVSPDHMPTAREFDEVKSHVAGLFHNRVVVGHGLRHDFQVLKHKVGWQSVRDTAEFSGFRKYGNGGTPSLRVLAKEVLGLEIQKGAHSSVEDARVAMLLYRSHKDAFEARYARRRHPSHVAKKADGNPKAKPKKAEKAEGTPKAEPTKAKKAEGNPKAEPTKAKKAEGNPKAKPKKAKKGKAKKGKGKSQG